MVLSVEQLNGWSNQGAQTTAKNTHMQVRNALNSDTSIIKNKDFEIFFKKNQLDFRWQKSLFMNTGI